MTKKKLKANEQVKSEELYDEFDRFEMFLMDNWRNILYAAAAIIIIVSAIAVGMQIQKANRFKAESTVADAKTIDELEKVIKEYPDLVATNAARLRLAMLYKDKKEYSKAVETLEKVVSTEQSNDFKWRAMLNIGYVYELDGKKESAAKQFEQVGSSSGLPDIVRNEANYSAGRIYYALENMDKAKSCLKMAEAAAKTKANQEDFWGGLAKQLLNRIMITGEIVKKAEVVEKESKKTVSATPEKAMKKVEKSAKIDEKKTEKAAVK